MGQDSGSLSGFHIFPAAPIQRQFQGWPICFNYPHPSKCLRRLAITIWLQMKASHSHPHCPSFPPTYSFLCPNDPHGLWLTGQNGPHRCVALWTLFWANRPCLINFLSLFFFEISPAFLQIAQPRPHPSAVIPLYISFSVIFGQSFWTVAARWQL